MSEASARRRIRAQASAGDPDVMSFVLDAPVQPGRSGRFGSTDDAPLAHGLFALHGLTRLEVSGATIWVRKDAGAEWAALKPAIAAAIREVLDETDAPLGRDETDAPPGRDETDAPLGRDETDAPLGRDETDAPPGRGAASTDPDAALLMAVKAVLDRQVNPSVASHGGHIGVDKVAGGTVFLRMSGGCQGCAASSATLRQGVERMLRAALPQIEQIVDVTDHAAGSAPFYARGSSASPAFHRPIPSDVIGWEGGQITVDPDYLAPRLGLTPETLRAALRKGDVVGTTETGQDEDEGKTRIVMRGPTRSWAAEIDAAGAAREIPPPRLIGASTGRDRDLTHRVRTHLEALQPDRTPTTYGAVARALGLWMPGSVGTVTAALEATMREDAVAGRPFIAARAVSRGRDGLPGKGFFDLACALSRGPQAGESEPDFHARELRLTHEAVRERSTADGASPQRPG